MELFGNADKFNEDYARTGKAHNLDFQPIQGLGRPRDIAYACLYFASDASRYLTGQLLHVGGGGYMPS
jgi:NAD(P)-dependent dehydrogenase (short-subunit alcohol dehydrogenase family)